MADCSTLLQQGLQLVQRATECDRNGNFESALRLYSLALEAFLSVLKMERNPKIVQTLNSRILEYMNRAEELKRMLRPMLTGDNPPPTERVEVNEWLALPSVPDGPFGSSVDSLPSEPQMVPGSPELAARLAHLSLHSSFSAEEEERKASPPDADTPPDAAASPWQNLTFGVPPSEATPDELDVVPRMQGAEDPVGSLDAWKDLVNLTDSPGGVEAPPFRGSPSPMLLFPTPPGVSTVGVPAFPPELGTSGVSEVPAEARLSTSSDLRVGTTAVAENSVGHSFETLFGRLLDGASEVCLQESGVRTAAHLQNVLRFAELCVKVGHCNKIVFVTSAPENKAIQHELETMLDELSASLIDQLIDLEVHFVPEGISQSQILCSTGWGAKLSRGLDMFKPPAGRFRIGFNDLSFRPTHAFTIELFRDE